MKFVCESVAVNSSVASVMEAVPAETEPSAIRYWLEVPPDLMNELAVIFPLVLTAVTPAFPSCILLLTSTIAPYPMAVELFIVPSDTSEPLPISVFCEPVLTDAPEDEPRPVLSFPVVLSKA